MIEDSKPGFNAIDGRPRTRGFDRSTTVTELDRSAVACRCCDAARERNCRLLVGSTAPRALPKDVWNQYMRLSGAAVFGIFSAVRLRSSAPLRQMIGSALFRSDAGPFFRSAMSQ